MMKLPGTGRAADTFNSSSCGTRSTGQGELNVGDLVAQPMPLPPKLVSARNGVRDPIVQASNVYLDGTSVSAECGRSASSKRLPDFLAR